MGREYIHHPLGEEVEFISGRYVLQKEERITINGREILYRVGYGVVDSSCCGNTAVKYALVPGFIKEWHSRESENGHPVSDVEPIAEQIDRKEISEIIKKAESVSQVNFL